jgi:hypothetical protein
MSEESKIRIGGIESKLDSVAGILLLLSIIFLVAYIIFSLSHKYQDTGLSMILFGFGVVGLFQGIIAWVIFKAGADVIRLLKKLNGLPFAGVISATKPQNVTGYECTECHAPVAPDATACPKCGTKFG